MKLLNGDMKTEDEVKLKVTNFNTKSDKLLNYYLTCESDISSANDINEDLKLFAKYLEDKYCDNKVIKFFDRFKIK